MNKLQDQILDILSSSMDTATALAESNRIIAEAKASAKPLTYYTKDGKQFTLAQGKVAEQQTRPSPVPVAKELTAEQLSREEIVQPDGRRRYGRMLDAVVNAPWKLRGIEYNDIVQPLGSTRVLAKNIKEHKRLVKQALTSGKPVPDEVLADYPDLAAKALGNPVQIKGPPQSYIDARAKEATWQKGDTLISPNGTPVTYLGKQAVDKGPGRYATVRTADGQKLTLNDAEIMSFDLAAKAKPTERLSKVHKAESGQSAAYDKASTEYRRLYDEWESALKNFKKTGVGGDRVKELQAQLDPALDRVDALFVSRNPWERVGNSKYDSSSPIETLVSSLQAIESSRSELSRTSDERQSHSLIVEPDDPRVSRWERDPGSMDIQGVDTPKRKGKYAVGKGSKTKKKRAAKGFTSLGTTR